MTNKHPNIIKAGIINESIKNRGRIVKPNVKDDIKHNDYQSDSDNIDDEGDIIIKNKNNNKIKIDDDDDDIEMKPQKIKIK